MSRGQDLLGILRGIQLVAQETLKTQKGELKVIWSNSSVRTALEGVQKKTQVGVQNAKTANAGEVFKSVVDGAERVNAVLTGVKYFATNTTPVAQTNFAETNATAAAEETQQHNLQLQQQQFAVVEPPAYKIKLTTRDKELLKKLDMEHQQKIQEKRTEEEKPQVKASPNPKSRQKLSSSAKQRTVPSSRIGRMMSFGSLAAGLGIGTAAEYVRRTFNGGGEKQEDASTLFLTQANMDRIVDTLCKVRGAALKLGQILSIQDETVVSPHLSKALERVRKSADFMPTWQVHQVLREEFGDEWREKFAEFHDTPFAAASIGQVHWGKLKSGEEVAVKIQYPGVAKGIESDIDNLVGIIKVWDMFPKGMFLDNLIRVAKRELAWEVDYVREAECTRKFRELLAPYPEYYVPKVIDDLSSARAFTTELIEGIPVDQCVDLAVEHKNFIAQKAMELCLLELLEFGYMQTDPNWANFFYDPDKKQLILLDFGASRAYSEDFLNVYVKIIKAAAQGDRDTVLKASREIGFLTGYESKVMEEAHVDAVMILGEVFQCPSEFNFAAQDTTARITDLMPTMLVHRLCPPPEEVYSLHRKLSGVFLLCSKLKVSIAVREKFLELVERYEKKHNLCTQSS